MVDTSKCETKQDLQDALRYEEIRCEILRLQNYIWKYTDEIELLKTKLIELMNQKQKLEQELDAYNDKRYVMTEL